MLILLQMHLWCLWSKARRRVECLRNSTEQTCRDQAEGAYSEISIRSPHTTLEMTDYAPMSYNVCIERSLNASRHPSHSIVMVRVYADLVHPILGINCTMHLLWWALCTNYSTTYYHITINSVDHKWPSDHDSPFGITLFQSMNLLTFFLRCLWLRSTYWVHISLIHPEWLCLNQVIQHGTLLWFSFKKWIYSLTRKCSSATKLGFWFSPESMNIHFSQSRRQLQNPQI